MNENFSWNDVHEFVESSSEICVKKSWKMENSSSTFSGITKSKVVDDKKELLMI